MCQADAASMRPLLEDVAVDAGFGPEDAADDHGEKPTVPEYSLTTVASVEEGSPGPAASLLTILAETEDHHDVSERLNGPAAELEDGDPFSSMSADPVNNTQRGKDTQSGRNISCKSSLAGSTSSISTKSTCSSKSGSSAASKSCPAAPSVATGSIGRQVSGNKLAPHPSVGTASVGTALEQRKSLQRSFSPPKKPLSSTFRDPGERLRFLKERVDRAIRERKIFVIHGCFPSIREALKSRGWMEKAPTRSIVPNAAGRTSPVQPGYNPAFLSPHETETSIISHLMKEAPTNFVWNLRSDSADYWVNANKEMIVSRLPRPHFTSKVGLCNYMKQIHWFCEDGVAHTLFPRCYNICQEEELSAFIQDFRMTACIGLIKWVVLRHDRHGETGVRSPTSKIPISSVQFALRRCGEYIASRTHEDIDVDDSYNIVWEHQWDQFLTWYYRIVHDNALLLESPEFNVKTAYSSCKGMLTNLRQYWPQLQLDGYLNTWIMKPGNRCRGRGIQLVQRLEHVLAKVSPAVMKESRYVVQKYIERPLLIHDTKFDIRQWFLVTSTHPLTVWMYKESYIRFCSRPFTLKNLHESVHLCNNAVQCRYKNAKRDPSLPEENMWDNHTFKTYLRAIGHAEAWDRIMYVGMRESIIGALLASQDSMAKRKNSFELFGADFMVTEDFLPWLIEINACPCMSPTTSVTARLCGQCLEDVIKVVIDRRYNRHAPTGMFELVYKQNIPPPPPYLGMALAVRGRNISRYGPIAATSRSAGTTKMRHALGGGKDKMHATKKGHKHPKETSKSSSYIGPIIVDLIEDLARHLDKNKSKKMRLFSDKEVHNAASRLLRDVEHEQQRLEKGDCPKQASKLSSKTSSGSSTPVREAGAAGATAGPASEAAQGTSAGMGTSKRDASAADSKPSPSSSTRVVSSPPPSAGKSTASTKSGRDLRTAAGDSAMSLRSTRSKLQPSSPPSAAPSTQSRTRTGMTPARTKATANVSVASAPQQQSSSSSKAPAPAPANTKDKRKKSDVKLAAKDDSKKPLRRRRRRRRLQQKPSQQPPPPPPPPLQPPQPPQPPPAAKAKG